MPNLQDGELQVFARVPQELLDEMDTWAERHYRTVKGEMCAAMEAFIHTPTSEIVNREWKYQRGPDDPPFSNGAPTWLVEQFKRASTRCRSLNEAVIRAFELWIVRHENAAKTVVTLR